MFGLNGLQKSLEDCTRNFNRMGFALEDIAAMADIYAGAEFQDPGLISDAFRQLADMAREATPARGPDYDRAKALV